MKNKFRRFINFLLYLAFVLIVGTVVSWWAMFFLCGLETGSLQWCAEPTNLWLWFWGGG